MGHGDGMNLLAREYGTSPKDGLPIHNRSTPMFTVAHDDVAEWHVSQSYGAAQKYLGATLKSGRIVWFIRAEQTEAEVVKFMEKTSEGIRRKYSRFTGHPRTMMFYHA